MSLSEASEINGRQDQTSGGGRPRDCLTDAGCSKRRPVRDVDSLPRQKPRPDVGNFACPVQKAIPLEKKVSRSCIGNGFASVARVRYDTEGLNPPTPPFFLLLLFFFLFFFLYSISSQPYVSIL